jgi:hypothetical protein
MATQTATATFDGDEDSVDVTWPAMIANYGIAMGLSGDNVVVWLSAVTATGATVNTSAQFTGEVDLLIYDRP